MRFYKAMLWKAYVDKGFSLLNYVKYVLAVIGIGAIVEGYPIKYILLMGVGYGLICLILGRLWFKYKIVDAEQEVQNNINPFVREMRDTYTNGKIYKV